MKLFKKKEAKKCPICGNIEDNRFSVKYRGKFGYLDMHTEDILITDFHFDSRLHYGGGVMVIEYYIKGNPKHNVEGTFRISMEQAITEGFINFNALNKHYFSKISKKVLKGL